MKVLLKSEFVKAIKNPLFVFSLIVGIAFSLASAIPVIKYYQNCDFKIMTQTAIESGYVKYNILPSDSLYKYWIGADAVSIGANLFYTLFPLLACLPYGWSLLEDIKSGYIKNIAPKVGRKKYFLTKTIVSFFVGGITVVFPILINLFSVSMFIPAIKMNVLYNQFFQIQHGNSFSNLAYNHPVTFIFTYLFISFIFAGSFSVLSTAMSFRTNKRLLAISLPFFVFLFSMSLGTFSVSFNLPILELSRIVKPVPIYGVMKVEIMALWFVSIALFSIITIWKEGKRFEIF